MLKVYFIAPLLALALFAAGFWNFKSGYHQREQTRIAEAAAEKEAKLKAEVEARREAIDEALRAQEVRKQERAAREAMEQARKESRQVALDAREKAHRDQEKLVRQLDRLKAELASENEVRTKLEAAKTAALAEHAFLRDFVQKADASVKKFEAVLAQIESAERTRAAAASTNKKS